ncbi:MAG: hypothetical protein ABR986_03745 [Methanomassiliicoccales archaeon]|jgi:hypothetical protein
MATKRKITVKVTHPGEREEEMNEELKPVALRRDRGWRDWFLRDYLRYWYFVGCLLGDVLVVLEVWRIVDTELSTSIPIIVLTALALIEFLVFLALWGKNGKWKKR